MRENIDCNELYKTESLINLKSLLAGKFKEKVSNERLEDIKNVIKYLDVEAEKLYFWNSSLSELNNYYYIDEENFHYIKLAESINVMKHFDTKKILDTIIKKQNDYIKNKEYDNLFMLIERKYRIEAFLRLFELYEYEEISISNKDLYEIFADVYTDSESGFSNFSKEDVELLLSMNPADYKSKIKTDDKGYVTIFRGESGELTEHEVYSWTLSKEVANWFANRYDDTEGYTLKGKVKIDNIRAYFTDRNEEEVIVFSEDIEDVMICN